MARYPQGYNSGTPILFVKTNSLCGVKGHSIEGLPGIRDLASYLDIARTCIFSINWKYTVLLWEK